MDLAKEAMEHNQDYVKQLAEFGCSMHFKNSDRLLREFHFHDANMPYFHFLAITFIYFGLTELNESATFENCIESESLKGILVLAKQFATSNRCYNEIRQNMTINYINTDTAEDTKIALMVKSFNMKIYVTWEEEKHEIAQKELSTHMITLDLKSAIQTKDPQRVFEAYQQCIVRAAGSAKIKDLCGAV